MMDENKVGCIPVVEEDGTLRGIITEADFIRIVVSEHECSGEFADSA